MNLELDLFLPDTDTITPLVIYVHGGGFRGGQRTAGHGLAKYLVSQNIACASITYTLYMIDQSFSCDGMTSEKIKAMQIAASQLWHATNFLISKSEEINIGTTKIFIAGSSAGAETVLHAAFWDKQQMQLFDPVLSEEFQYAGVVAGAGAIMDLNLITQDNLIPIMMFHGDADPLVPYGTAAHHYCPPDAPGWLMFFGSASIARHIENLEGTCQLTTFREGKHDFAGAYFFQDQYHVYEFIQDVIAGRHFVEYYEVYPDSK
jgi:acetyl esterase/lipase